MKIIVPCLLLGFVGCNQPATHSAYPDVVAGEAIRLASDYCYPQVAQLDWLRNRIDSLENAPYGQQRFVYVLRKKQLTLFAIGPAKLSRFKGPLLDCRGSLYSLSGQDKLTATIIYTPPAYRH